MSPILDVQYRLRELGRLRMGMKGKRGAPQRLDTWRMTCASKELLEAAAELYGGKVRVWEDAPNEGDHFELITDSDAIDIIIPPNEAAFSQWMELWTGGGCKKRCDGQRQVLRDVACSCPADINERIEAAKQGEACKPVTRFNVMLPKLPDVGVWRLETHGYNAARELAGFAHLAELATQAGQMIIARLRIDHRSTKRPGEGTHRFVVPVIEISETLGTMLSGLGIIDPSALGLPIAPLEKKSLPGERPELPADASFDIDSPDVAVEPSPAVPQQSLDGEGNGGAGPDPSPEANPEANRDELIDLIDRAKTSGQIKWGEVAFFVSGPALAAGMARPPGNFPQLLADDTPTEVLEHVVEKLNLTERVGA